MDCGKEGHDTHRRLFLMGVPLDSPLRVIAGR
jgi:hypothetical protein